MTTSRLSSDPEIARTGAELTRETRLALLVGGISSVLFGVAVLVWPTKAAVTLTGIIAFYAVVAGLVYAGVGVLSRGLGLGARIGNVVLGFLYLLGGVFAFTELQSSAAFLAVFLVVLVGLLWMLEGFVALLTLGGPGSRALTIVFALLSIVAGATLVSSPLWGAIFLWWFLAVSLIALGLVNVLRAVTGRKR